MNILDLEEFEILEKYKSEEYYKFVVKAKDEPMFCSKCGAFADDGKVISKGFTLGFPH